MKFLLLFLVIAVAIWWLGGRRRGAAARGDAPPAAPPAVAAPMLACANCGLHLPQAEAQFDVAGKPYCSARHRLAGPR